MLTYRTRLTFGYPPSTMSHAPSVFRLGSIFVLYSSDRIVVHDSCLVSGYEMVTAMTRPEWSQVASTTRIAYPFLLLWIRCSEWGHASHLMGVQSTEPTAPGWPALPVNSLHFPHRPRVFSPMCPTNPPRISGRRGGRMPPPSNGSFLRSLRCPRRCFLQPTPSAHPTPTATAQRGGHGHPQPGKGGGN